MKKLSVALFSVLFLAVVALFILQFTGGNRNKSNQSGNSALADSQGIAYVNIDSVIYKFEMFKDRQTELLAKQKNAETELTSKGTQYEKNVKDYQDKASKGLITRATASEMEQSLYQQQQELVNLRDKLQSDLLEEDQVMNRQIIEYITKFLEENKAVYNYQFVLGKSFGSVVLYANTGNDITEKVIADLNKKYQTEKK